MPPYILTYKLISSVQIPFNVRSETISLSAHVSYTVQCLLWDLRNRFVWSTSGLL